MSKGAQRSSAQHGKGILAPLLFTDPDDLPPPPAAALLGVAFRKAFGRQGTFVGTVVAHQGTGADLFNGSNELFGFVHRGGDGFFQQKGQACLHAPHGVRQVQSVGCGQDDCVGAVLGPHVFKAGVQSHASGLCVGQGLDRRVDHTGQCSTRVLRNGLHVGQADVASTGNGNAQGIHGERWGCQHGRHP
jgi:hypothetical protein